MKNRFDCIVIGGGHAGIEASHAAAKMGAKTCLITIRKDKIGEMSCNPAIGGIAKGQIAREIDALGGLMGLAIDDTGIQFKTLNSSKGPAVHAPRAQADRHKYQDWMENYLEKTENLTIIETTAEDILTENEKVTAVACSNGQTYKTDTVIVTTGTFLKGQMYIGDHWWDGGRINEPPSEKLSDSFRRMGLKVERLATGTPPRLDAKTIDFDKIEKHTGDDTPKPFSFMNDTVHRPQIPCWITYTNNQIHRLLKQNMHRAPISLGKIKGTKPRYCPSIEAKMIAYPDKDKHRIILEPEEEDVCTIYANGLFTSVPKDVQEKMLRLLPGTENVRIKRYGYGIEYDYCPPYQLKPSLETKKINGLFMAGQINATSGYEEAAGQGIIAGINAVRKLQNEQPLILKRDEAYIGVMIDDLMTMDLNDPYRMFTSRAEYRLLLRADNADRRLTPKARNVGLVDDTRWKRYSDKVQKINHLKDWLQNHRNNGQSFYTQLRQPDNPISKNLNLIEQVKKMNLSEEVLNAVAIDAKYEGYLKKQERMIKKFENMHRVKIPKEIDYQDISHLKREAKDKFTQFKPTNLAQASRIAGITPADVVVLQVYLKKQYNRS